MRHCEAFISVDNALMHFAAAMKVPKQLLIESMAFGPTLEPYRRPYFLVVLTQFPAEAGRTTAVAEVSQGIFETLGRLKRDAEEEEPVVVAAS